MVVRGVRVDGDSIERPRRRSSVAQAESSHVRKAVPKEDDFMPWMRVMARG